MLAARWSTASSTIAASRPSRRERPTDDLPDVVAELDPAPLDPELVTALAQLPPRMRAAVVLRHVHDLSVDEVARMLQCDPGTVKSQTARGLGKLRARLGPPTNLISAMPTSQPGSHHE